MSSRTRRAASHLTRARRANSTQSGHGANTMQDRGAWQHAACATSNPYFSINPHNRWREYVRLYMTAWEARKLIEIPVDDALRKPFEIKGMEEGDAKELHAAYDALAIDRQLRRALIQERLFGGAILLPILRQAEGTDLAAPLPPEEIRENDLEAVNLVDVTKIRRGQVNQDVFTADYDTAGSYLVDSVQVDVSRLVVFDGSPLIGRGTQNVLEPLRTNYAGLGESKLAPVYDILTRFIGTQQGAYHLVNLASVLLLEVENIIHLEASCSPALAKLREITEQISIYRAGIIDGRNAKVSQHAASFGSVPELMMSFAQLLAAAGDIPASRYLGQIPGSLNATGDGDAENYYNAIDSYLRLTVTPARLKLLGFVGSSLWGPGDWRDKSRAMELYNPPLWNLSETETAQLEQTVAGMVMLLKDSGLISEEAALNELKARGIFRTEMEVDESGEGNTDLPDPSDPEGTLAKLRELTERDSNDAADAIPESLREEGGQ